MSAHARFFPPSGLDRAMVCTASVALIDRLISKGELKTSDLEDGDSISEDEIIDGALDAYSDVVLAPGETTSFSAEGTVMHEVRQLCLEFGLDPFNFVGKQFSHEKFSFEITEDMADKLLAGLDWIRQHTNTPFVEIRVDLSQWLPDQFGTCDTAWLYDGRLFISDLKWGAGKPVSPEKNRQLMAYALGVWHLLGRPVIKGVVLNIDQPRAGGMKFWDCSFEELHEFGEELKRVYARVMADDVEFVPTTKGCQWCPVRKSKRGCAAYNQWALLMLGTFDIDQGEPKFRDPAQMSRTMRYYIVKNAAAIRSWLGTLYSESLAAAISGDPDPGSKAIMGDQGNRFFTDAKKAEELLSEAIGDAAYKPRQMIGITEIERLVKPGRKKQGHPETWADLLLLVDRPPGRPKLVPADHPSPAFIEDTSDEFDDAED